MMEPPDNAPLTAALRALFDAPEYETDRWLRPALEAFVASTLIAGQDDDGPFSEEEGAKHRRAVRWLDADVEDGVYLALFTDLIELHMFEPNARWIAMTAEEAIRKVAEDEFDGLILNPAGKSFELSREDVRDFFDID